MLTIKVSFDIYMTKNIWLLFMFKFMIASRAKPMIILRNAEMPTVRDLKSGGFCFITPRYRTISPPPPKKKEMRPPPNQIDLHAPLST